MTVVKLPLPPPESEERWLQVWGHWFRVLVRPGRGETTRPVVLLNGIGCRAEVLDPFVDALDPSLEIIRVDPPGIGGTRPTSLPYGMPQMAAAVLAMVDQLGHAEVDVIGYSWGGVIAQQMALQGSRRVRRLVLLSTNAGALSVPGSIRSLAMMFNPLVADMLHDRDEEIGRLYGGVARRRAQDVRALLVPHFERTGSGLFHQLAAAMTWTTLPLVWLIRQPTLIVAGEDDPMVPFANAQILRGCIPGSRLIRFDGGHIDPLLEPDRFAEELSRFLVEA